MEQGPSTATDEEAAPWRRRGRRRWIALGLAGEALILDEPWSLGLGRPGAAALLAAALASRGTEVYLLWFSRS